MQFIKGYLIDYQSSRSIRQTGYLGDAFPGQARIFKY